MPMRATRSLLVTSIVILTVSQYVSQVAYATMIIDDFSTVQGVPSPSNRGAVSGGGILGAERDLILGSSGSLMTFAIGSGQLSEVWPYTSGGPSFALDYDGIQGGVGSPDIARQLPITDFTQGGANNAIVIPVISVVGDWQAYVRITSGVSGNLFKTLTTSSAGNLVFLFSEFSGNGDLTQANGVYVDFRSSAGPASITLARFRRFPSPSPRPTPSPPLACWAWPLLAGDGGRAGRP